MNTLFKFLVSIGLAVSFWAAQAQMPQAPEIAAKAYLLMDVTANQVLAAKDPDMAVEPASLTKLMTAYLVFDALKNRKIDLQQTLPVSERAWKMPGSRMFIDPKMKVPVEDLIKGMIVQSGNDATVALAEGVAGSVERFVQLMNDQAVFLGMLKTQYKNPEGLTAPGHTTTARDLALLATRLMRDFPQYVPYYAIKKYRYECTPAANDTNRNLLLFRDTSVDGLKTGHTQAAGYCLVASAKRELPNVGARRLLSVVLGAYSENARANESQKLLNWGYLAFDAVKLFDANDGSFLSTLDGHEEAVQAVEGLAAHHHRLAHGQRLEALEVGGQAPGQIALIADRAIGGAGIDQDDFGVHGSACPTRVTCPILRPERASRLP